MPGRSELYVGRAGQLAVMAEFLLRGYNVAIPEVDVGDDVFVVKDSDGDLSRIQVKTARKLERLKKGFAVRFTVREEQLLAIRLPRLHFVIAIREQDRWTRFVVIPQGILSDEYQLHQIGTRNAMSGTVTFRLSFHGELGVRCGKRDFSSYLANWSYWPQIEHAPRPR